MFPFLGWIRIVVDPYNFDLDPNPNILIFLVVFFRYPDPFSHFTIRNPGQMIRIQPDLDQQHCFLLHILFSSTPVNIFKTGIISYIQNFTNQNYSNKFLSIYLHIFIFVIKSKHYMNIFLCEYGG